jgi:hypothetical protein
MLGMTTNHEPDYEANIAANLDRILHERENLNPHRIAQAMTARGVPIDAKGIARIVAGQRRVKFNEALCLMNVLGLSNLEEIAVHPDVARSKQLLGLLKQWRAADAEAERAIQQRDEAAEALRNAAAGDEGTQSLLDAITQWNERRLAGKANRIMTTDFWMYRLTGDDDYRKAWQEHLGSLTFTWPDLDGDPDLPPSEHPDAQDV